MSTTNPQIKRIRRKSNHITVRSRVEEALKNRLTHFRNRPDIRRSEGFILRQALECYLDKQESTHS